MKKLLLICICTIVLLGKLFSQPVANSLSPKVDIRVELVSIIFKLAKIKGISENLNPFYSKAIENHFDKYDSHPLIKYITTFADSLDKHNIEYGYWNIQALAIHLTAPPVLKPIVNIEDISNIDVWEDRTFLNKKIVSLIQQFYKDAECDSFFRLQQKYY